MAKLTSNPYVVIETAKGDIILELDIANLDVIYLRINLDLRKNEFKIFKRI